MILALEATDSGGSIAFGREGKLLDVEFEDSDITHSERLMPVIDGILEKREVPYESIERIGVARGPGSFTSIRLAVTTAKTLAMLCDAELVAPTTLRVMAEYQRGNSGLITTVIDARRQEVYVQQFKAESNTIEPLDGPELMDPESVPMNENPVIFRGRDLEWSAIDPEQKNSVLPGSLTRPLAVPLFGLTSESESVEDPDTVSPCYVRKSDAQRHSNGDGS
jgi:tRNA threonylcarbamoyl adenosine modification protein YeaZ